MTDYFCLSDILVGLASLPEKKLTHTSDLLEICGNHQRGTVIATLADMKRRGWVETSGNGQHWGLKHFVRRYVGKDASELLALDIADEVRRLHTPEGSPIVRIEALSAALLSDEHLFKTALESLSEAEALRVLGAEGGVTALFPLPGLSVYGRGPGPIPRGKEKPTMSKESMAKKQSLEDLIQRVRKLQAARVRYDDPQITLVENHIKKAVAQVFGSDSPNAEAVENYAIWQGGYNAGDEPHERQTKYEAGFTPTLSLLESMREDIPADPVQAGPMIEPATPTSRKVFIVHGSNHAVRDAIELFLHKELGLDTVVMEAGAHKGRTLLEKFEETARECGFAVFILTADDHLKDLKSQTEIKRARQNVLLETGYFWGRLGRRDRVAFLVEKPVGMELPSDIEGIGYIAITADLAATKLNLRKELEAAGLVS